MTSSMQPQKPGKYRCIVIDPPWDQKKTGKRLSRPNQGIHLDYPTMSPDDIKSLPIPQWADTNCLLWLWATNSRSYSQDKPILEIAFDLLKSWDFRFYTLLTWDKRTGPCPFGPYQITTEHVLFAYKGKADFSKKCLGKMKTLFSSIENNRYAHSQKPKELYAHIREFFKSPRLDIFARRSHIGFEGIGNEYKKSA